MTNTVHTIMIISKGINHDSMKEVEFMFQKKMKKERPLKAAYVDIWTGEKYSQTIKRKAFFSDFTKSKSIGKSIIDLFF